MIDLHSMGLTIVDEFITEAEEAELLSHISPSAVRKGSGRNSIKRYGSKLPYNSNLVSANIPDFLDAYAERLASGGHLDFKPDSVTINEYMVGQSITPHIDSKSSGPIITILCLNSEATMWFSRAKQRKSVLLKPRSIVQMRGEIRNDWMHSIDPVKETRYSIVFRLGTKR